MDAIATGRDGPPGRPLQAAARPAQFASRTPREWRQIALITLGAVALFVAVRALPTGTNLAHVDFQVSGGNIIQFCDPANPAFIPVVAVKSPVTMTLAMDAPPVTGRRLHVTLNLRTTTGKPIAPEDLLIVHEHRLHLMVVDPSLRDYEHVHPVPGRVPGAWDALITPRRAGLYRVFADFTPAATGRGLYASAEFTVPGTPDRAPSDDNWSCEADGLHFTLTPGAALRARQVVDLKLTVESAAGGQPLALEPVMGAYAHLVAFDQGRSGFAHIHPSQAVLDQRLDPRRPQLAFRVQIPQAGRYVIWSQVKVGGRERFAPFWFEVAP
ncbi:MAG TPA: hypothetical protein VLW52_00015 [Opitutaceae bacterium]|nr:hypothetical protein [Opitutaceae bacterium]